MKRSLIEQPSKKCNWRSQQSTTRLRSTSGALRSVTPPWQTTMRSILLGTDLRSGCRRSTKSRHCDMRWTSTCLSRMSTSRRDLKPRSLRGDASSTTPTRLPTGLSLIVRATAFVYAGGQTGLLNEWGPAARLVHNRVRAADRSRMSPLTRVPRKVNGRHPGAQSAESVKLHPHQPLGELEPVL